MALFGLACPMCILLMMFLLFYNYFYSYLQIKINNNIENFTDSERYFPSHSENLNFNNFLQTSY